MDYVFYSFCTCRLRVREEDKRVKNEQEQAILESMAEAHPRFGSSASFYFFSSCDYVKQDFFNAYCIHDHRQRAVKCLKVSSNQHYAACGPQTSGGL